VIRKRTMKNGKDHYQVIVRVKRYPDKVKTFSTKRKAESWEIKLKAAMKSGYYYDDAEAQRQTLGNAIDRYLTEILLPDTKNRKTISGTASLVETEARQACTRKNFFRHDQSLQRRAY
jgi:hypothetical protein